MPDTVLPQSFYFPQCLNMKSNHSPSAKWDQISMESKRVHLPKLNSVPVQSVSYHVDRDGQSILYLRENFGAVSLCYERLPVTLLRTGLNDLHIMLLRRSFLSCLHKICLLSCHCQEIQCSPFWLFCL